MLKPGSEACRKHVAAKLHRATAKMLLTKDYYYTFGKKDWFARRQ
jgi:hypothetical protein